MSKIATLILNYKGLSDTIDCLESLSNIDSKGFNHKVFVVDYSKENQFDQIKSKFPNIQVFRQEKNLGFAAANNYLIKKAQDWGTDYVHLLNNDTLVSKDFLITLYQYLEHEPKVGAVSPKIYFAKGYEYYKDKYEKKDLGKVIWYAGGKIDWDNVYGSHIGVDEVDHGQFDKTTDTDFFSGCCVLIRADVLDKIGGFDPKYFLYWEDTDLSMRIKKDGYCIKYLPTAHIWHKNAGSSGVGSSLHDYFLSRNRLYFAHRYANLRTKLALHKQSLTKLKIGSKWEKQAIKDFYFAKMGIGSWPNKK
jgi:GT2 family glycosyltransferase